MNRIGLISIDTGYRSLFSGSGTRCQYRKIEIRSQGDTGCVNGIRLTVDRNRIHALKRDVEGSNQIAGRAKAHQYIF